MREPTAEEKDKLKAMVDKQNREREKKQRVYLKRKIENAVAEQAAKRASESGFQPLTTGPRLESTVHRTRYHLISRNKTELRSMQLTGKEKEKLKDKVWGMIRERHKKAD
jgi:hypothetical protein